MQLTPRELVDIRKRISQDILPKHFEHFERFLNASQSGWLANTSNPTMADIFFGSRLRANFIVERDEGVDEKILTQFPRIQMHFDKFVSIPTVKKYYDAPASIECLKIIDVSHLPASPLPEVADVCHIFHTK